GNDHLLPALTPIRCCKPWNIFKPSFRAASARQPSSNSVFSIRFWDDRRWERLIFSELEPSCFFGGRFRAGDNTTIPSLPRLTSGSVAGVNANHLNHSCEIPLPI